MHRDHICWMPMANINFLNTKLFSFSSRNSGNDATAYHLWVWTCNRLRQKLMQIGLKVSHKTTKKRRRKKNWVSSSYSIPCNDSHKQPEWFTLTWQHNVQVKAVVTGFTDSSRIWGKCNLSLSFTGTKFGLLPVSDCLPWTVMHEAWKSTLTWQMKVLLCWW